MGRNFSLRTNAGRSGERRFRFSGRGAGFVLPRVPPMDAIDRKILTVLQEDCSLSVAEIGARVGLSSTPCWKRIQRLEADGVILKRVALVDQDKLGLGVTVFVSIETGDHSQDWLDRFAQVGGSMPEGVGVFGMG